MSRYLFCVDESPFCVYEHDLSEINKRYINGITPEYLYFICAQNEKVLNDKAETKESKKYASMNLRITYAQSLETLFSLLFAMLQAPGFIPGWMMRYKGYHLKNLIQKVNDEIPIKTKFYKIHNISWKSIVGLICHGISSDNPNIKENLVSDFSKLLSLLAMDFQDKNLQLEYKSIKHGNRANFGGGVFKIKESEKSDSAWRELLKSDYGSSYYTFENIKESNNHFTISHNSIFWDPQDLFFGINFIGLLIHNIVLFLKGFNKMDIKNLQFKSMTDSENYTLPWKNRIGTGNLRLDSNIDVDTIEYLSKEDIYRSYDKPQSET